MTAHNVHYKLTKNDVKALRTADFLVFFYKDGKGFIKAGKELKKGVWGSETMEKYIDTNTYIQSYEPEDIEVYECSYCMSAVQYTHWIHIAELLKENDVLTLRWIAKNNNQYLNNAGLFCDELHIEIKRETKTKIKRMRFMVDTVVCRNNPARMCQVRKKR